MFKFGAACLLSVCSAALAQVTATAKAEALQAFETLQSAADEQFERCRQAARAVFLQSDANSLRKANIVRLRMQ